VGCLTVFRFTEHTLSRRSISIDINRFESMRVPKESRVGQCFRLRIRTIEFNSDKSRFLSRFVRLLLCTDLPLLTFARSTLSTSTRSSIAARSLPTRPFVSVAWLSGRPLTTMLFSRLSRCFASHATLAKRTTSASVTRLFPVTASL